MTEHGIPDWFIHHPQALTPQAAGEVVRSNLEVEYEDKFNLLLQVEAAAFDLAAQALVRHGQPTYVRRSLGSEYYRDPLATSFRLIGEPVYIPHNDQPGIVVPAISVGLGALREEQAAKIPYKDIERVRKGKADIQVVARALGSVVNVIEFQGYLLATHLKDVETDMWATAWSGIVRQAPVGSRWQQLMQQVLHAGAYDPRSHIKRAIRGKADLAMWSVPHPDIVEHGRHSGTVPLVRNVRPNLAPYRNPTDYDRIASSELDDLAKRLPVRQIVMEMLHIADAVDRPVASLGAPATNPVPKTSRQIF